MVCKGFRTFSRDIFNSALHQKIPFELSMLLRNVKGAEAETFDVAIQQQRFWKGLICNSILFNSSGSEEFTKTVVDPQEVDHCFVEHHPQVDLKIPSFQSSPSQVPSCQ